MDATPPRDLAMKIAVDAMGGDGGVPVSVEGAIVVIHLTPGCVPAPTPDAVRSSRG